MPRGLESARKFYFPCPCRLNNLILYNFSQWDMRRLLGKVLFVRWTLVIQTSLFFWSCWGNVCWSFWQAGEDKQFCDLRISRERHEEFVVFITTEPLKLALYLLWEVLQWDKNFLILKVTFSWTFSNYLLGFLPPS